MDFMSAIIEQRRTKRKGDICALFFATNALVLSKKKPSLKSVRPCHIFAIYFEINIVCVFGAELTIKPPFLTKNVVFHPRTRIPLVLARNARSNPQ